MSRIGIIGFGRFGQLTTRYLARDFSVVVHTRSDKDAAIRACGAGRSPLRPPAGSRL